MKKNFPIFTFAILCFGIIRAGAQFDFAGGQTMHMGPDAVMEKLYGSNQAFSATMEMQLASTADSSPTTVAGKIFFDNGSSRFEMDMSEMKGGKMPPNAAAQMKSMGFDRVVTISQPGKKAAYMIYPNLQSYIEITPPDSASAATNEDSKIEATGLGKETVDSHPCTKNKTVITDKQGTKHEFTVWNADDLKNFPIKIETEEQGIAMTMSYKNISFFKPEAALFNPPASYTRYDNVQEMLQQVMMKRMGVPQAVPFPPPGN